MKKNSLFILLFLTSMFITVGVKASTCSDERVIELSSLANNVNVSYQQYDKFVEEYISESFTGEDDDSKVVATYPAYYLTIYNLPEDLNVSVVRSDSDKDIEVTSKDKKEDGVIYIDTGYATNVKLFTIKIRSNDSNCGDEIMKTVAITTPMFNKLSMNASCQDNPDFKLCQQFTTTDYSDVIDSQFQQKLEEYKAQKAGEEKKQNSILYNISKFVSKYRWYIIIPVVIIGVALIVIYIIRRKKSRLI